MPAATRTRPRRPRRMGDPPVRDRRRRRCRPPAHDDRRERDLLVLGQPGTYTVCETISGKPGWVQSFPSGTACTGHTHGGTITPGPAGYADVVVTLRQHGEPQGLRQHPAVRHGHVQSPLADLPGRGGRHAGDVDQLHRRGERRTSARRRNSNSLTTRLGQDEPVLFDVHHHVRRPVSRDGIQCRQKKEALRGLLLLPDAAAGAGLRIRLERPLGDHAPAPVAVALHARPHAVAPGAPRPDPCRRTAPTRPRPCRARCSSRRPPRSRAAPSCRARSRIRTRCTSDPRKRRSGPSVPAPPREPLAPETAAGSITVTSAVAMTTRNVRLSMRDLLVRAASVDAAASIRYSHNGIGAQTSTADA